MVFSSLEFVFCFLPVVLLAVVLVRKTQFQNWLLLCASLVFYSWGEPKYVFLFAATILLNWALVWLADSRTNSRVRKIIGVLAICLDAGILFWFKYAHWIGSMVGFSIASSVLPVGISFYTFQAISYVADVTLMNKYRAERNPAHVGLYISFFPQLIAGPIVRYEEMSEQIKSRRMTMNSFEEGSFRFIIGFCKKVLLADSMGVIVNRAFGSVSALASFFAWLGAVAYAFQIYFDFSGYSDMAIGLGKMFGFNIPENFRDPYHAKSIRDFWRRWHITLSIWFRDYVYIPLGGNRKSGARTVFNIAVVWLLTGFWHGANYTFVLWGVIYGCFVLFEKTVSMDRILSQRGALFRGAYRIITLLIIILQWVIFRANGIRQAGEYIVSMFSFGADDLDIALLYLNEYKWAFITSLAVCFIPLEKLNEKRVFTWPLILVFFICGISYLVKGTYSPFLYFHF